MSRIIFFFSEAFRALRRNGAPTLAAVITTVVTVVLLGVLIPIFQTAQAKSDEVRSELSVNFALYDGATNAEIAQAKEKVEAVPGVASVAFISKQEALQTLKGELKDKSIVEELHTNPLPASLQLKAADDSDLPQIEK
jgi:cell division transport system permease protein